MSESSRGASRAIVLLALPALLAAGACKPAQQAPKTPLGQMTAGADSTANPHTTMSPDARAALDSGNAQYRAGKYADALKSYRKSSELAPLNAAPFFGIYMAAEKLGNKALADSASAQIKRREGPTTEMLTDSALQEMHAAGAKKPTKG
ncbi:MAG TPA: tetratricopeptide repeat protein [Gemmatimonadaceae bacterium]